MIEEQGKDLIRILWYNVRKSIEDCNDQGYTVDNLKLETESIDVFPTKDYTDEQANRFGLAIMNAIFGVNAYFDLKLEIDFPPRKEFELFPTIEDVFVYLYCRVTGLDRSIEQILSELEE